MFNNTQSGSTYFNAPATGIIQKSNAKSFFISMHHKSQLADEIFGTYPKYNHEDIAVLQVLLTHDEYFLVEAINIKDFNS